MADPPKIVTKMGKIRLTFWPADAHSDSARYTTHTQLLYTQLSPSTIANNCIPTLVSETSLQHKNSSQAHSQATDLDDSQAWTDSGLGQQLGVN